MGRVPSLGVFNSGEQRDGPPRAESELSVQNQSRSLRLAWNKRRRHANQRHKQRDKVTQSIQLRSTRITIGIPASRANDAPRSNIVPSRTRNRLTIPNSNGPLKDSVLLEWCSCMWTDIISPSEQSAPVVAQPGNLGNHVSHDATSRENKQRTRAYPKEPIGEIFLDSDQS